MDSIRNLIYIFLESEQADESIIKECFKIVEYSNEEC